MITSKEIKWAISEQKKELPHYQKLYRYYKSQNDILKRTLPDKDKPNNRIATSYAHLAIETIVGYLATNPIAYISRSNNENYLNEINDILFENNEEDTNAEHVKFFSMLGKSYELIYAGNDTKLRFDYYTPLDMFVKKDRHNNIQYGLRHWEEKKNDQKIIDVEVYDKDGFHYFQSKDGENFTQSAKSKIHIFEEAPISVWQNNVEETGDFEKQIPLIDSIDKLLSDSSNELESYANAYLVLKGYEGTEREDVKQMKQDGILLMDENGEASWLVKQGDYKFQNDHFEKLDQLIHDHTGTPKMTSESFSSNLSSSAIRNKLFTLDSKANVKERKMEKALRKRVKLITKYINFLKNTEYNSRDISFKFTRNIHQDASIVTDQIVKLQGRVDEETLLSWHPNISEPSQVIKKVNQEQDSMGLNNADFNQGVGNGSTQ